MINKGLFVSAVLAALPVFFCAAGQELGFRDFGNTVDSRPMPPDNSGEIPEIGRWLPFEEFAEDVRESLWPAVSMSSVMELPRREPPKHIIVLPNNALKLWRISVSNGSAGNWGAPPANFLDARTLSFPTP